MHVQIILHMHFNFRQFLNLFLFTSNFNGIQFKIIKFKFQITVNLWCHSTKSQVIHKKSFIIPPLYYEFI